jgi:DNA-binding MarR family transcriptional regulator
MSRRVATKRKTEAETGPVLDLRGYVPALLTFLANKLTASGSATYRRQFGVGITEWRIMAMLAVEPWIPAQRICQVIGFDKGPVSRSLAALEARGLVSFRAEPGDPRRRRIALSGEGRALHDRIIAVALQREAELLSCLGPCQRAALIEALNLLHDNLPALQAADRLH